MGKLGTETLSIVDQGDQERTTQLESRIEEGILI
jgi:hypothetical protein